MPNSSLKALEIDRRAYGQYLNYLVNHKAKGVNTIGEENIPILDEIREVGRRINDLKKVIRLEKTFCKN